MENLFDMNSREWQRLWEASSKAAIFALIFGTVLWFVFWFIPAWHQKRKRELEPLSSRDQALQMVRDVYIKLWKNSELGCVRNLGPALTLYLSDRFGADQLQFDTRRARRLRRSKKISRGEARLLFKTAVMLKNADEYRFPARTEAMEITWDLQKMLEQSAQPLPKEGIFRR